MISLSFADAILDFELPVGFDSIPTNHIGMADPKNMG